MGETVPLLTWMLLNDTTPYRLLNYSGWTAEHQQRSRMIDSINLCTRYIIWPCILKQPSTHYKLPLTTIQAERVLQNQEQKYTINLRIWINERQRLHNKGGSGSPEKRSLVGLNMQGGHKTTTKLYIIISIPPHHQVNIKCHEGGSEDRLVPWRKSDKDDDGGKIGRCTMMARSLPWYYEEASWWCCCHRL